MILSVLVVLWLVVPGPRLGHKPKPNRYTLPSGAMLPPPPVPSSTPYPVLGDMLPEAPVNEQGLLVSLRALDTCEVRIEPQTEAGGPPQSRTVRVSEPWRLRVRGPFSVTLSNAGVASLEVAGRRIAHPQNVGEAWTGRFDADGRWIKPAMPELPKGSLEPDEEEIEPEPAPEKTEEPK